MKQAKYKLIVTYANGESCTRLPLTQKRCYEILKHHQENDWRVGDNYIDSWEIRTGKQKIEF